MKMEGMTYEMPRRGHDWVGLILSGLTLVVATVAVILNFAEKSALREANERLARRDRAVEGKVADSAGFDEPRKSRDRKLSAAAGESHGRDAEGDETDVGDADHRLPERRMSSNAADSRAGLVPLGRGATNLVVASDALAVPPDRVGEGTEGEEKGERGDGVGVADFHNP